MAIRRVGRSFSPDVHRAVLGAHAFTADKEFQGISVDIGRHGGVRGLIGVEGRVDGDGICVGLLDGDAGETR